MNKFKSLAMCLFLLLLSQPAWGTDWYVDGTRGLDANPGTLTSPWKTIHKANQTVQAGDTVFIRAGEYLTSSRLDWYGCPEKQGIMPIRPGRAGEPITYTHYPGERVVFRGSTCGRPQDNRCFGVVLDAVSYIVVRGLEFQGMYHQLLMENAHHNEIADCRFEGMYSSGKTWNGSRIHAGSSHNWLHHSTFCKYGSALTGSDYGVVLEIGDENVGNDFTSHNLIEDCHLYHGGHHVLGLNGSRNVARNNYLHNEAWMPDAQGALWGNRLLYLCTSKQGCNLRNLVENNRLAYSYTSVDAQSIPVEANKIAHSNNIIRRNLIYQHVSSALSYQPGFRSWNSQKEVAPFESPDFPVVAKQ
ncbi:MAG: right-handed parallel beta-helix repeat-containing protein, partial [Holophaga sp.]|nr:right-handed parallel beta-helix repeat-containing protein [Holophaga sp.]